MRYLLLFAALGALAALPATHDVESLLRAGDAAAARGDMSAAVAWYERAEPLTFDPGRVAFNLATARYYLARAGNLRELPAAEAAYRSCLTGERRGRALFGLGNCLLLRAGSGASLDAAVLRAAADRFLESRLADASLADDARYNEEHARLLLMQAIPRGQSEPPPAGGDEKDPRSPQGDASRQQAPSEEAAGNERTTATQAGQGPTLEEKDGAGRAGAANPMPIPEARDAVPLDPAFADQQIDEAARRIVEEWRANRRQRVKPREGARDW